MKKSLAVLLGVATLVSVPATLWAASGGSVTAQLAPHIKLLLNGRVVESSTDVPMSYNNKTYVPLRLVSEALGYEVKWDGKNETITFELPEERYPLIENGAVELISAEPNYDFITSLNNSSYLGGINLDFVYTLTEDVDRPPVIVMETLNKDRTVLASETKLLKTKAGTYTDFVISDKFRLPYDISTEREQVTKQLSEDYYFRITVK